MATTRADLPQADRRPPAIVRPSVPIGRFAHIRRYREIAGVLVRHGFDDAVEMLHLTRYLSAGRRLLSSQGPARDPDATRPERLRRACEELGPTFIKFGQALSTRADLLPPAIVAELARLQDDVPPLDPGVAERTIEAAFGRPIGDLFAAFETEPIAAASIAQVHRARLRSGELVAVKVRRPDIDTRIEADLAILADLAAFAEQHLPWTRLYSPAGLVEEFARTTRRELNLAREGRILDRVAAAFAGNPTVQFPAVAWSHTNASVLTMEFLEGVKLSLVGTGAAPGLDPRVVARRGADLILEQILEHGLFHADPHPGNILVMPGNVVAMVDFGIVGRLNQRMRDRIAEAIVATGRHDAERLAELVVSVATPLQPVDMRELARDIEEMLDLHADRPLGELSMAELFGSITETMSRHRLKLPADLLLLIKAVTTIEGVGRQLDPAFTVIDHAAPFVEARLARRRAPLALARRLTGAGHDTLRSLSGLPGDVAAVVRRARAEGLQVQFVHRNLDHFIREMDRASNRLSFSIVIAAVVVGSAVIMHAGLGPVVFGYPALGLAGFVIAGVLALGLAAAILRSGRL